MKNIDEFLWKHYRRKCQGFPSFDPAAVNALIFCSRLSAEDAKCPRIGNATAPLYSIELLGDATISTMRLGGAICSVKGPQNYRAEIVILCHLFSHRKRAIYLTPKMGSEYLETQFCYRPDNRLVRKV